LRNRRLPWSLWYGPRLQRGRRLDVDRGRLGRM